MEALTLTFSAAVLMGLAFGAGPCNIACLPYLGPVFLSREDSGVGGSWRTIAPFSAGRVASYSLLGAIAGGAGAVATGWLEQGGALLLGTATVLVGILLFFKAGKGRHKGCSSGQPTERPITWQPGGKQAPRALLGVGLFGMGAAMALNPCVPLGTVLLASAATAHAGSGLLLGFGFGIGAVLIPSLLFGILVAHFGAQIRFHLANWGKALERASAALLVALGSMTALGWVQP